MLKTISEMKVAPLILLFFFVSSLIPFLFFFDAISGIDGWDGISVWGDSMSTALRC